MYVGFPEALKCDESEVEARQLAANLKDGEGKVGYAAGAVTSTGAT